MGCYGCNPYFGYYGPAYGGGYPVPGSGAYYPPQVNPGAATAWTLINQLFGKSSSGLTHQLEVRSSNQPISEFLDNPNGYTMPATDQARERVADRLHTLFQNRQDLMDLVLNPQGGNNQLPPEGLEIIIHPQDEQQPIQTIGLAYEGQNRLHLSSQALNEANGDTVNHEFVHLLDGVNGLDGILPNMSPRQQALFTQGRERLKQQYQDHSTPHAMKKILAKFSNTHPWWQEESLPGLRNYAFRNDKEFLATTVETFLTNPEALHQLSPELYQSYQEYFQLNPIQQPRGFS